MQFGHQVPTAWTITTLSLYLASARETVSPLISGKEKVNGLASGFSLIRKSPRGIEASSSRSARQVDFQPGLPMNFPFSRVPSGEISAVRIRLWAPSMAESINLFPETFPSR